MSNIKDELREFIINNYLKGAKNKKLLKDDDSFLEKGIIDSIGVIELASFMQEHYGIKIEVPEIMPENFDTLNSLEKYIKRKSA